MAGWLNLLGDLSNPDLFYQPSSTIYLCLTLYFQVNSLKLLMNIEYMRGIPPFQ
jgi:hypothetical protein